MALETKLRLRDGWLETNHAVFVRDAAMTDESLFAALGIVQHVIPVEPGDTSDELDHIYVARDAEWVHVMDGLRMPMRRHRVRGALPVLAQEVGAEIFWFWAPHAFEYYAEGALVRHYEEIWSQLDGLEERIDVGEPLAGELDMSQADPDAQYAEGRAPGRRSLREIARSLGITHTHQWETLRVYACPLRAS